jgi:uncharacterized protein YndB with AHSA1/START domain
MPDSNELVVVRDFFVPLEKIWNAWTNPEEFVKWWGPKGFTSPHCTMDVRVGGKYVWCLRSPEGKDFWTTGEFIEVVPMNRLIYTDSFADANGNPVPASEYGMEGEWPLFTTVTVTLEEEVLGKVKMTLRHVGIAAGRMTELTGASWNESFDKMENSFAGIIESSST